MLVKDIMSNDVVYAESTDSVLTVAKLMKEYNIGVVPVMESNDKVLGVITDRDIVMGLADYNFDMANTYASKLMSDKVYSVRPGADLSDALALMKKQQIRRLPVIEQEKLVGMISIGDIAVNSDYHMEMSEAICEISMPTNQIHQSE